MCIADALYIWDRYLDAGDRFTGQWEPSCNTRSKYIRKDDQNVTCVYENCVEHEDALLWKTDTKGKQSQVRTYEQEVCESWFLVDSVTILEGARAIGTPGYEEEELDGMWKEIM